MHVPCDLELLAEGLQIAQRKQVLLSVDDPQATMREILQRTAPNVSSMLADVQRGVETEVDFINGKRMPRAIPPLLEHAFKGVRLHSSIGVSQGLVY